LGRGLGAEQSAKHFGSGGSVINKRFHKHINEHINELVRKSFCK
jgi:hypothetical protein